MVEGVVIEIPIPDPGNTDNTLYCEQWNMLLETIEIRRKTWQIKPNLLNICDVDELDDFVLFGGCSPRAGALETKVTENYETFGLIGLPVYHIWASFVAVLQKPHIAVFCDFYNNDVQQRISHPLCSSLGFLKSFNVDNTVFNFSF